MLSQKCRLQDCDNTMMQIWFVFATEYVALWDLEISGEKKKGTSIKVISCISVCNWYSVVYTSKTWQCNISKNRQIFYI